MDIYQEENLTEEEIEQLRIEEEEFQREEIEQERLRVLFEKQQEKYRTVEEPYLKKRKKFLFFSYGTPVTKERLKEPLLELMRNNGFNETIEGVEPGEFVLQMPNGKYKSLVLTTDRLRSWKYGNEIIKKWVAHEDNVYAYPQNPIHSARAFNEIVSSIVLNIGNRDKQKSLEGKGKMILYILIGVAVLITLVFSNDGIRELITQAINNPGNTGDAVNNAVNVVSNLSKNTTTNVTGGVQIV